MLRSGNFLEFVDAWTLDALLNSKRNGIPEETILEGSSAFVDLSTSSIMPEYKRNDAFTVLERTYRQSLMSGPCRQVFESADARKEVGPFFFFFFCLKD